RSLSPDAAVLIVAVSDFSGVTSSALGFAQGEARAATDSLDRCMAPLRFPNIKTHPARPLSLCAHPMPNRFFGVLGNERLKFALGPLVVEKGPAGAAEQCGEFCPGIRGTHVDDTDRLDTRSRRLSLNEVGSFAGLDATPEFFSADTRT